MDKIVIFESMGTLCATNESNFKTYACDVRKIHYMNDFENPKEIMDYYIKYGWATSYDDFIVEV